MLPSIAVGRVQLVLHFSGQISLPSVQSLFVVHQRYHPDITIKDWNSHTIMGYDERFLRQVYPVITFQLQLTA